MNEVCQSRAMSLKRVHSGRLMPGRVYGVPGSCLSATAAALSLLLVLVAVSLPAADGVDATTTSAPGVSGSASIVTSTAAVIKPAVTAAPTSAAARPPALERPMLSAVLVGATIAAGLAVLVS